MNRENKKLGLRERRHKRVRVKISGSKERPRISIFRSNRHIYGQVVDDILGKTLISLSDIGKDKKDSKKKYKRSKKNDVAYSVGLELGEKMKVKKIKTAVLDRGGFKYHGRVKSFAEGLRKSGIKI